MGESTKLGQSLAALSLEERAQHYRAFANEAFRKAAISEGKELRAGYLSMAAGWHTLALEIERTTQQLERLEDDSMEAGHHQAGGD
jgi:hypothetical protein